MLAALSLALTLAAPPAAPARANLKDAAGATVATAELTQTEKGVRLELRATALPAGPHGFHVHAVGQCAAPDFKSAGGHFNPGAKEHGMENPKGHHAGDLPNLVAGTDGKGSAEALLPDATLGEGKGSLFQEGGTALVIHAGPDDLKSDPAGNSGARIACGVVEKAR